MSKLKVHNEKYQELAEKVAVCFHGAEGVYDWRDLEVDVRETSDKLIVSVWQMYEYLPMTFAIMEKLAEVFGSRDYNINNWSSSGCETCDYNSRYTHEFTVPKVKNAATESND